MKSNYDIDRQDVNMGRIKDPVSSNKTKIILSVVGMGLIAIIVVWGVIGIKKIAAPIERQLPKPTIVMN